MAATPPPMRTFGLIPAAGKSVRMGRPKLLLPLRGRTVLEHVVDAVHVGGVAEVLVVAGPHGAGVADAAARAGAHVLRLEAETPDMRATCERGLVWLEERFAPRPYDGWLLLPADHPTLAPAVIAALLDAARETGASVVVPTFGGRRGHPVWLNWSHVEAIRALPVGEGLNVLVRQLRGEARELPWPGDEILRDLDTPEDYERLLAGE